MDLLGILISWLGLISEHLQSIDLVKRLVNTLEVQRIKQPYTIERLISFNAQGLIPLFILLCFPFTPNIINKFCRLSYLILDLNIISLFWHSRS